MIENEVLELVRLAREGNNDAFGQLVLRYEPMVFATVCRRLKNRTCAREVTQDVFIQMLRKIGQLREDHLFEPWLRKIAVRLAINKAIRKPKERLGEDDVLGSVRDQGTAPLDHLVSNENALKLRECLNRMRELDRETLVAFYFDGRSLQEMSDQFASPVGTIKRRLHTARNRLKETMTDLQLVG